MDRLLRARLRRTIASALDFGLEDLIHCNRRLCQQFRQRYVLTHEIFSLVRIGEDHDGLLQRVDNPDGE